ncbi:Retrovirus-related Pol polyprotein from transposon 17.6 [Araneus ventricosus]|uniref:RNA-directed DNA polymerase n=2 Tax=Araneus ventricosus TaxID=182803 RepID=A0A4Y2H0V4_ARAVE|nr:Retrovirus-related Pol polyprotein from transposon 17.6 [Araneus ventricosus]
MALLYKAKKAYLRAVADELGIEATEKMIKPQIIKAIMASEHFEEQLVSNMLEEEEVKSKDALEVEEKRRNEEIEDRRRREQMEFELQKLRLENERCRSESDRVVTAEFSAKPKIDLHTILQKFEPTSNDISLYLILFERQAKRADIQKKYWVSYLIGLLPSEMSQIIPREDEEVTEDYEKIKTLLLKRYKLTPERFRQLFVNHNKAPENTWTDFVYEVKNYFHEWIRGVNVKTFEELSNLIITEQIKKKVSAEIYDHFLDEWSQLKIPEEFANKLDDFENVRTDRKIKETSWRYHPGDRYRYDSEEQRKVTNRKFRPSPVNEERYRTSRREQISPRNNTRIDCYICGLGHIARECPKRHRETTSSKRELNNGEDVLTAEIKSHLLKSEKSTNLPVNIPINALQYVTTLVDNQELRTLVDSGAQIPVINEKFVSQQENTTGKIILTSAFGERIEAGLVKLQISLKSEDKDEFHSPIEILAAVSSRVQGQFIIPTNVYELLRNSNEENNQYDEHSRDNQNHEHSKKPLPEESSILCAEVEGDDGVEEKVSYMSESSKLIDEQKKCESLEEVRKFARRGKGDFLVIDGLLFHREKMLGDAITQLVLPLSRRAQVLRLAHESVFGSHMGVKKTKERIRYSFYWPMMSREIAEYCKSCKECQLRSPEKMIDKIPITPVLRPELPFECVNVDIIGPIEPPSARRHKYVLCLIDQHSRWPEAIPLRSLTAKSTCDALLEIFMRTGIPKLIASDQGTNFVSNLTQEFVHRLGSSPRFLVPGYAASNGLVERYNQVLKNALHHVIRTESRNWDKYIPYLLFAYREVPNCTTGVSPFKLMYGREARGPLNVLKSSWCGEISLPLNMKKSAVDYLQELKINFEIAAEQASIIAAGKQKTYADYFNRRTKSKEFSIGEQVYLLIPDSSNKLYARWTGPGEVIQQPSAHSYKIKLPDGKVRHCHVNKIRRFYPRVNAVGIVFEDDNEFGEIYASPRTTDHQSVAEGIQSLQLQHLSGEEKAHLIHILMKHQELFRGKVKIAKVGKHKIRLETDKERNKPYVYRIPEALKEKVDSQIVELLELDLIEESSAEIAHPVVCGNKKDGSMRMCVDYRTLNSITKADDFPMEDAVQLLQCIGKASVITTLDLLKGYWAIPMEEDSRDLTSFKTHRAQYRFKVMPFGLRNAAATFQREMNKALGPYRDFSRAYIDDIAIFSNNMSDHLLHLDTILSKLEELQFTVNLQKCSFARPEIKYLGHIVGSGKHQTDPDKIRAIAIMPAPTTKKQLRSVLGLCNYYRDYIPHYAEIALPLTELTKKKVPENLPWSEVHETAFNTLKEALVKAPALHAPDMSQPFIIHTDASQFGIAACLSQKMLGSLRPIAYVSQKLSKSQQAWSTIEREAYAIVWSLKKFETLVFGSEIELYTDHNPLSYLTKCAPQSARLQRWVFALQKYHITVRHCPGVKMPHADALSRLFPDE